MDLEWVVDISGIDVDADVGRAEGCTWVPDPEREMSVESTSNVPGIVEPSFSELVGLGEVIILSPTTLEENFLRQQQSAPPFPNPFDLCTVHDASEVNQNAQQSYFFEEDTGPKILKVFCLFLREAPVYISLKLQNPRGVDLVKAVLIQALRRERESMGYPISEKHYNLFMADNIGNPEISINPLMSIQNFDCFCIQPIGGFQCRERLGLLPTTASDIRLTVHVNCPSEEKVYHHECITPADMFAERLEPMIARLLPNNRILRNSLRIHCGDAWLRIWDECDFGPGVGANSGRMAEHTMLSLYRCGVREVEVRTASARAYNSEETDEFPEVVMTLEEAKTTHQISVYRIADNAARQPRVLQVSAVELEISRPGSGEQKPKIRRISDIEKLEYEPRQRTIRIEYKWKARKEPDVFEFNTVLKCATIFKKLELLRAEVESEETSKPWWGILEWWKNKFKKED